MKIATYITSLIYGTQWSYNKITKGHLTNSQNNYHSPAKLIINNLSYSTLKSANWILAQRTNFFIFDDHIVIKNIKIDISKLHNVEIVLVKTWFGLLRYSILYFKYNSDFYSIGLQKVLVDDKKYFQNVKYSEVKNLSYTLILPVLIILYFIYTNINKI